MLPCELSLLRQGNVSHHQFTFALSFATPMEDILFCEFKVADVAVTKIFLPSFHSPTHLSLFEFQMQSGLLLQLLLHARYRTGNAPHPEEIRTTSGKKQTGDPTFKRTNLEILSSVLVIHSRIAVISLRCSRISFSLIPVCRFIATSRNDSHLGVYWQRH